MPQEPDTILLQGGLDLVSPGLSVKPGFCVQAKNYEVEARGYRRISGYEPFDGQTSPSDNRYHALYLEGIGRTILEGETITGATSGATAVALVDSATADDSPDAATPSWHGLTVDGAPATFSWNQLRARWNSGIAHGHVALVSVAGTFVDGEGIQIGGVTIAHADGTQRLNGAPTPELNDTYLAAAAEQTRANINAVPGSGPVRGVATYRGSVYAWRDSTDGTRGQMFRATATGWIEQTFGRLLQFQAGTAAFLEDETVTGSTSGATGTIERMVRNDGSWGTGGDATGYLVLSGVTGAFQSGETITSVSGSATALGADSAITLPPGGKYRAIEHNFYGQDETTSLYVANGVGRAFEWDGTVLAPVRTGLSDALDKPLFAAVHRDHLFLGYQHGSVMFSAVGQPLVFDAVQGAGEFGFGQDLTGMLSFTVDSLVIAARNRIGYLTGTDASNFDLKIIAPRSGAIMDTLQAASTPLFMDDQGVRDMQAVEAYGDWKLATLTRRVEPLVRKKRESGVRPIGAMVVRSKDQYRLFYADGTALVVYLGREQPEIMPIVYDFAPACVHAGEDPNGEEVLFAGADDGWVYRLDRGTSFNGAAIEAFLRTSFLNHGHPNRMKRYHRALVEGHSGGQAVDIGLAARFSYGAETIPAGTAEAMDLHGGGQFWTEAYWEDPHGWGTAVEGQGTAALDGIGENVSLLFRSESSVEAPHTLSAVTINWTARRRKR